MAKKKNKKIKKKNNKKNISFKQSVLFVGMAILLVMFIPTSVLLLVGMLPTMVAYVVDRHPSKNKTFTIGAMNFVGCFPYLLEIWLYSNSMEVSINLISQPKTIIVMYAAAALGYGVNIVVTYIVSALLLQRADVRVKRIEKEKMALVDRWGDKVNTDPYAVNSEQRKPPQEDFEEDTVTP